MIVFIFSTYSSGSTLLQGQLSKYIPVLMEGECQSVDQLEFGFLNWAAKFVYTPTETIDSDPIRTFNPATGKEVPEWRDCYRNNLTTYLETNEEHFLKYHCRPLLEKYKIQADWPIQGLTRSQFVIKILRALDQKGEFLGKNPKWMNDFSGHTTQLLEACFVAGINIKGICLSRDPLDLFVSLFERNLRLNEVFGGNKEEWADYVKESIAFSVENILALAGKYNFLEIKYEFIGEGYKKIGPYLGMSDLGEISSNRKSRNRYLLNPWARKHMNRLIPYRRLLGYNAPLKVNLINYCYSLLLNVYLIARFGDKTVNSKENSGDFLIDWFWDEWQHGGLCSIRKLYHKL